MEKFENGHPNKLAGEKPNKGSGGMTAQEFSALLL